MLGDRRDLVFQETLRQQVLPDAAKKRGSPVVFIPSVLAGEVAKAATPRR